MIDLSKAKEGDTVVFRIGGKAKIEYVQQLKGFVNLEISGSAFCYSLDGKWDIYLNSIHPFDIVAIELAPEPKRFERYLAVHLNGIFGLPQHSAEACRMAIGKNDQEIIAYILKITCTDDPNNPDPKIEVVK